MKKFILFIIIIFVVALIKFTQTQTISQAVENTPRTSVSTFFCKVFNYGIGSGIFVSSALIKQFDKRLPLNPQADFKTTTDMLNNSISKVI